MTPALAADALLQAKKEELYVDEAVALRLTLVDGQAPKPELDLPDGIDAVFKGAQPGFTLINFRQIQQITWTWILVADQAGTYPIGPIELDGGVVSNGLTLTVSERPEDDGLTASLGAEDLWVGQTVVYAVRFQTRLRMLDRRWTPPPLEGFAPEGAAEQRIRENTTSVDGVNVTTIDVDQPLVATAPGQRTVPPSVLTVQTPASDRARSSPFGFLETRSEVFASQPLKVAVRPLPEGQDPALWSGLVGAFTLSTHVDTTDLALGESATIEVVIEGNGTMVGLSLPELHADGVQIYDDTPDLRAKVEGGVFTSRGVFRRAVVPEREGEIVVPGITLQVFDPVQGTYSLLSSEPVRLSVGQGAEQAALESFGSTSGTAPVSTLETDILPMRAAPNTRSQLFSWTRPGVMAALAVPVLALLGVLGQLGWSRRPPPVADPRGDLRRELAAAPDTVDALEPLFRRALGLALGTSPSGVQAHQLSALSPAVAALYSELAAMRFGGGSGPDLPPRLRAAIQELIQ